MKYTKEQVIESIKFFAKDLDLEKSYEEIIKTHIDLPALVKMIVYDMFVNEYQPHYSFRHYHIILSYAKELKYNGYVIFEEN